MRIVDGCVLGLCSNQWRSIGDASAGGKAVPVTLGRGGCGHFGVYY